MNSQVGAWLAEQRRHQPAARRDRQGLRLRLLADRRLPEHLHQRDPPARDAATAARRSTTATSSPSPAAASSALYADQPVRGGAAGRRSAPRRSATSACRSSGSCRSRTIVSGIAARRPDSDTPQDPYRHYEMAGTGHATPVELYYSAAPGGHRQGRARGAADGLQRGPAQPLPDATSSFDAVLQNLDRWVRTGIAPPRAEPIQRRATARRCSTSSATWSAACARRTSTCRRAPGSAPRPAPRSASSPATSGRSRPRSSRSCTRPRPTTWPRSTPARARWWRSASSPRRTGGTSCRRPATPACPARPTIRPRRAAGTTPTARVGGTVPATLSLTLGAPATFGAVHAGRGAGRTRRRRPRT